MCNITITLNACSKGTSIMKSIGWKCKFKSNLFEVFGIKHLLSQPRVFLS